jgi:hypothetical protein
MTRHTTRGTEEIRAVSSAGPRGPIDPESHLSERERLAAELAAIDDGINDRALRTLEQAELLVQIAEDIPGPLRDLIRDTPLASHQRLLLEVARAHRDPEERRRRADAAIILIRGSDRK